MAERPPITDDRARQFYVYATAWDMGSEPSPGAQQARSINANEWDAWLAAHDARVRRDAAREALDGLVPMLLARRPQCPARDGDGVTGYQCGLEQGHGGCHEILHGEFRDWYSIPEYRDARYPETEDQT